MVTRSAKGSAMIKFTVQRLLIRQSGYGYLTPKDEQLLDAVARAYVRQEQLTVKDLMRKTELGSPASVHARIKFLRAENLIEYLITGDVSRYHVVPTEKLLRYFDELGNAIKYYIENNDQ